MKQETLIPTYYNEFSCIGSACEDTCCAGWKVSVDKESFNKYRKITSGPLAQELQRNITRERKTPSDMAYGKIKMDSNGACTLLQEDGLCKIHSALGEEYLCHTCTVYPRNIQPVDTRLEKSLGVSCPEAARLILLNPNGIDFVIEEEDVQKLQTNQVPEYFWEIRMFTIELLQIRSASIEERLIVLGMFSEKVEGLPKQAIANELPAIMERYRGLLNDPEQLASLAKLPNNISFQMDLVRELLQFRISSGFSNIRYKECLNDLINGLQMTDDGTIENSMALYKKSYTNYYQPFMNEHAYMFENYLVNSIFKTMFPINITDIFKQYVDLIIHFILVKIHLIGIALTHNGLTKELFIKCIQSFSKMFEHNYTFFYDVMKKIKEHDYLSMAYMTILIKS